MILKTDGQKSAQLDWLKWLLVCVIVLAGLVVNHYYYDQIATPLRMLAWFATLVVAGLVASLTRVGKEVLVFFKDSRAELRKVVWPTRHETMQTALIVIAMVVVLALILWGLDGILVWLIGWLTGQHG